ARFIMNNDLSRIDPDASDRNDIPRVFWYPLFPQEITFRELVRRRPSSAFRVALVCIAANYQSTYDALSPVPHYITYQQAHMSHNRHFARDIERRAAESGVNLYPDTHLDCWTRPDKGPTSLAIEPEVRAFSGALVKARVKEIYPGDLQANAPSWELTICVPEEPKWRVRGGGNVQLYPESYDIKTWKAAIARR
ncbi:hypothetical protein LZ31DRAFT_470373, partial [Colletotrichum somersetense]